MNEALMEGMPGIPVPYLLRSDWMVTSIMFLCMLMLSYVLSRGKKHLHHQFRSLFSSRERASMFDEVTATDLRYNTLLVFHTCLLLGFCIYDYFSHATPVLFDLFPHAYLLGGFVLCVVVLMLVKWAVYRFVNWVFFQKARNLIWSKAYFNLLIWLGFLLFPVVLLIVYFDLSPQTASYLVISMIALSKIVLFYKCFCNFFGKIDGFLHLILYFCALEILPDLVLWKGIEMVNNNLILNT